MKNGTQSNALKKAAAFLVFVLWIMGMAHKRMIRCGIACGLLTLLSQTVCFGGGVTLITHGWNSDADQNGWLDSMAAQIANRTANPSAVTRILVSVSPAYLSGPLEAQVDSISGPMPRDISSSDEIIISVEWSDVDFWPNTTTQEVAEKVADLFFNPTIELAYVDFGGPLAERQIHLIGHSRGGSVVTEIARILGESGVWVDQVTTLDPHPVDGLYSDAPIKLWDNIIFADNYYRHDLDPADFDGENVSYADNTWLRESVLSGDGYSLEHQDVHLWYHGTIDLSLGASDGPHTVPNNWYGGDHPNRSDSGFYFSRLGGGTSARSSLGLHPFHGGFPGATDRYTSQRQGTQWANIGDIHVTSAPFGLVQIGSQMTVTYRFHDHDSGARIDWYLDNDTNPYNTPYPTFIDTDFVSATGQDIGSGTLTRGTSDISPDHYYLCAKITSNNGGHIRYAYAPGGLTFSGSVTPLAAPANLSAVAVSSSQINLVWSDTANETGFKIERRLGTSGSWSQITTRSANVTSFSDTGRAAGTAYSYRVRAYNAAGDSDYSATAGATTQAPPGTTYALNIASSNPSSGVAVNSYVGNGSFASGTTPTSRSFAAGTAVGVACQSRLASGLVFQKWQLDGNDYSFSDYTTVTMNSSHTLTAVFGAAPLPPRVLSSLTIEGPSSVDELSSAQYHARANYTDGSSAYVDGDAEWDDDTGYASISTTGLLDTDAVSSDRDIEIEATFTAGGVTRTRTKGVTIRNTDAVPTYTLTRNVVGNGEIGFSPKGNSYAAGTVVSLHANEDDGYVFSHWTGDASGMEDDIEIAMTRNKSVTAHFVVDINYGNLQVNISPAQANAEGAAWNYDLFTAWRPTGDLQDGITPRINRYLHFKDIPGWVTPDEFKVSIVGGQTTVTNATYREILGSVQVTLSPVQASVAGARWRLDGGPWTESGVALADASTGTHTIEFFSIPGWNTPPSQTVSVARGVTSTRNGDYGPPAGFPIITSVSPRTGPIAGGTTVTIEGANFQAGAAVSFGAVAAVSITVVSPTQISAVTPSRASYGSVALSLTSGGQTVTQANGFSYLNALGSNIELVGQIGGNVQAVAVVGNTVYYGEGPGLVVSDFTNPSAPVERGRIAMPAVVQHIVVVSDIAFVATGGAGLYAVDVSIPTAPSIIGFFDTEGSATGVTVSGGLAYVADGSAGLQILDVTNPEAIVRRGLLDTVGRAVRVAVIKIASKQYAFLAEGNLALRVIDVTTPNAPTEITNIPAQSASGIKDVKVVGTTLYVSDSQVGVMIFDATNPTNLVQIGSRGNVGPSFIDVVGNRLYTCGSGLRVADLSITPVPTNLGYFDPGSSCYDLAVANNLAFAAMGRDGLKVVNVSNPASMFLRSAIETLGGVEDVWVSEGIAFVGNDSGLHTVDVSNPARPVRLATLPGDLVTDLVVANGKATLVSYGDETVRIANVANPASPSLLGTYTGVEAWNVALMGSTPVLAAATRDAAHLPKLDVLNLSSPSNPQSGGSVLLDSANGIAADVAVVGGWAFVGRQGWAGNPTNALDVISLENPNSPKKIGTVSMPSDAFFRNISASEDGNYVYVAYSSGGIQIVDVSVKTAPALGQMINPPQTSGGADSVQVLRNRLYADEGGYIFGFDISNAASPQMLGYYDIPGSSYGIAVVGDLIFVGGGNAGVSILRLMDVDKPTVTITSPTANTAYFTNAALLTLGGVASDDQGVVRVSWENNRGGGGVANGMTSWQVPSIQLAAGVNIITVTAEDANGNLATDILAVTANLPDTTPPVITITGPKPDDEFVVETSVITLSGSAADNQSVANLTWSNDRGGAGTMSLAGQNWSITDLQLAVGPNLVQVTATDSSGNMASDIAVIFFAPPDTNAPSISIEFPTLNAVHEVEFDTLNLSGMATDNWSVTKVEWSSNRGGHGIASGVAPWSVNDIPLQPGLNVIEVTATDGAGNTSSDTLSVNFTLPIPALSVAWSGSNLVFFWPTNAFGFSLESATDFPAINWTLESVSPAIVNDQYTVTNVITGERKFYRLRK